MYREPGEPTGNDVREGRFEDCDFNELCKVLIAAPGMGYPEALLEQGTENMPGIYDLASIKRYFFKREKLDVLEDPGVIFEKDDPILKKISVKGQDKKIAYFSHTENPDIRYMWTNEFIGEAPAGHPAEGEFIMAKIEGIDMNQQSKDRSIGGLLSPVLGGSESTGGRIIISADRFVKLIDTKLQFREDNYGQMHCGQIQGFEEINGLMVPITLGADDAWENVPGRVERDRPANVGFGDLTCDTSGGDAPIALRPSSWSDLGFNTKNSINSKYKVVSKSELDRLINS